MPRWHEIYNDIPVDVSAEWDAFQLSLRDLSNLQVDDVIEMDTALISQNQSSGRRAELALLEKSELDGDQVAFQVNESLSDALKLIGKKNG